MEAAGNLGVKRAVVVRAEDPGKGMGLTSGPGLAGAQRRAGDTREHWQVGPVGRGDDAG